MKKTITIFTVTVTATGGVKHLNSQAKADNLIATLAELGVEATCEKVKKEIQIDI